MNVTTDRELLHAAFTYEAIADTMHPDNQRYMNILLDACDKDESLFFSFEINDDQQLVVTFPAPV